MSRYLALMLFTALLSGQDRSDWQALSQLQPGDHVKLSLKGQRPLSAPFQAWDQDQVTVGATTARREEVAKLERYRKGVWGRGKTALVGAAIGSGAGAIVGYAGGGCSNKGFAPCPVTRGELTAAVAVVGALVGAGIGALLPHHRTDAIYQAK